MKSIKEQIIGSNTNMFSYHPNEDRDPATTSYNERVYARLETIDYVLKFVPKIHGVDLVANSIAISERMEKHNKKHGEIPEWWQGLATVSTNVITDANWFISNTPNLLHEFFNSKSDANKYLSAEQQEDMESEFKKWCIDQITL